MLNRFNIAHGYWLYALLWNGENVAQDYWRRLRNISYRPAPSQEYLETSDPEAKATYGRLVRKHHADYVAYERLYRRHPEVFLMWPGSHHVGTCANFVRSLGLDPRCLEVWS